MATSNSFTDYAKWLAEIIRDRQAGIVSIDGCDGVGKSPLARHLASLLDGTHICVDDYLHKHKGSYLDALNWGALEANIVAAIQLQKAVIIEGLCLLEVLTRVDIDPEYKVYMQVYSPDRRFVDDEERWYEDRWYKQNVLDCENGEYRDYSQKLDPELCRYHRDNKPRSHADLIVLYFEKRLT